MSTNKKAKSAKSNVMTDKAQWKTFPLEITSNVLDSTVATTEFKFHQLPKLTAFSVASNHAALKDLKPKPTGSVLLLKTGYSSALVIQSSLGKSILSKKIMFTEPMRVTPLSTSITAQVMEASREETFSEVMVVIENVLSKEDFQVFEGWVDAEVSSPGSANLGSVENYDEILQSVFNSVYSKASPPEVVCVKSVFQYVVDLARVSAS